MKEKVYLETSFFGYLTARLSNNLIVMANAEITKRWWNKRKDKFALYISQVVTDEAQKGDQEMAIKRREMQKNIPILRLNEEVKILALEFLQ